MWRIGRKHTVSLAFVGCFSLSAVAQDELIPLKAGPIKAADMNANFELLVQKIEATKQTNELLKAKNEELLQDLRQIKTQLSASASGVPSGGVLAFDLAEGCPDGWKPFKEARARVIVGAGDPSESARKMGFDENGKPLQEYAYRQHGGEQTHRLTVSEMPKHNHAILRTDSNRGDGNFVKWDVMGSPNNKSTGKGTQDEGDSKPHNNMQPFVALEYCKKV